MNTTEQPHKPLTTHVPVLDHLRGLAALSVCFYHFTNGNVKFLDEADVLRKAGSFGWLGVEAFFVISGFVIPYSLHLRGYRLQDAGSFIARRLKRLEPPYFACILLVIALQYLSSVAPGYAGDEPSLNVPQLLAHVGYLNAILNYPWLNPVFWTLAIEFQFYFFVACIFPMLNSAKASHRISSLIVIALLGFLSFDNPALLPYWLPLFALGMAAFHAYVGFVGKIPFLFLFAGLVGISCVCIGIQQAIVGALTALTILLFRNNNLPKASAPLAILGTLSYSIYLLHVPIGGRIINLGVRLPDSVTYRYPALFLAFIVSFLAAFTFWVWIEKPSQRWAKQTASKESESSV